MKKIFLALLVVSLAVSSAWAGPIGIRFGSLIRPTNYNVYGGGWQTPTTPSIDVFYGMSDAITVSGGLSLTSDNSDYSYAGVNLAGFYNFGSGRAKPHVGLELDYWTEGRSSGNSGSAVNLGLLLGGEVMLLDNLSLTADMRVVDMQSEDFDGNGSANTLFGLLEGASFGFMWYL